MRLIRTTAPAFLALSCMAPTAQLQAAAFTVQTFATGAAVGGTSPDPVEFGDGSPWISYQNGADSAGASGASTVVRYSPSGSVLKTWSIAGNVDGLRIDPSTGFVWALQNNDGNSALTVINPLSNATTAYIMALRSPGNRDQPSAESRRLSQSGQPLQRLDEDVLREILSFVVGNIGEKDAVNQTPILPVQRAKSHAVTALRGANQRGFLQSRLDRGEHEYCSD